MISQTKAVQLLKREKLKWRREQNGKGDFVNGFMAGINFAIAILEELGNYTKERMKNNPHYVAIMYRQGK